MEAAKPVQRHSLGLIDMVSLIVGIVVGTGIFETPPLMFQNVPDIRVGLGVWVMAGFLCFVGALCYAELACTYPRTGGDYVYLTRAYGSGVGFLFAWAQLGVILPANIGMMAYVFSDYALKLWEFPHAGILYALAAVLGLSLLNILGFVLGRRTQNVLSLAKVVGLSLVVVVGFVWSAPPETVTAAPAAEADWSKLAFAMVLVFITYGGWNDAAYVAAEMRDTRRNVPLALMLGIAVITLLYVLINGAYLTALGLEGVRNSKAVASSVLEQVKPLGPWGGRFISVLVMISALGTINGLIFTGSRVYSTLGADYTVFGWWGRWHPRLGVPIIALASQGLISAGLIVLVGTAGGRSLVDSAFHLLGLGSAQWEGRGGFETLLKCTAPLFWFFFLLTATSVFVLRVTDADRPRPFSVPLYPVVPGIFWLTCAYMVYSGVTYAEKLGLVGGGLVLVGVPLYLLSGRRTTDVLAPGDPGTAAWSGET